MALGCVFHFNVTEAVLLNREEGEVDGTLNSGLTEGQEGISAAEDSRNGPSRAAKLNSLETSIFDTPQCNSSDQDLLQQENSTTVPYTADPQTQGSRAPVGIVENPRMISDSLKT